MLSKVISGIQQVGIGNPDTYEAWKWYRQNFGMDIPVFDEAATAGLMLLYTGGLPQKRHAVLAVNIQGGGGFEIWQYTERKPEYPRFEVQLGDLGIYVAKIKCKDVKSAFEKFKTKDLNLISDVCKDPSGNEFFFVKDPYGNIFQVQKSDDWFTKGKHITGGLCGVVIGVSDIEKAKPVYSDILGYDETVYDIEGVSEDLKGLPGGTQKYRRVLLKHSKPRAGAFSRLLGTSRIELIKAIDRKPCKIFEDRFWGDIGFIHLCFDISGMKRLRHECFEKGFPFTVDTLESFDMGEAAGSFAYIEDPDGTLIEFVETHKVPVIKKLGLYLRLKKRNEKKPLPDWMVKTLAFNRVKD
ncbi:MAG: VOC family protein [Bacteroidia bacterium]|nr:VOC family protein [Bacteroidia bacterium]